MAFAENRNKGGQEVLPPIESYPLEILLPKDERNMVGDQHLAVNNWLHLPLEDHRLIKTDGGNFKVDSAAHYSMVRDLADEEVSADSMENQLDATVPATKPVEGVHAYAFENFMVVVRELKQPKVIRMYIERKFPIAPIYDRGVATSKTKIVYVPVTKPVMTVLGNTELMVLNRLSKVNKESIPVEVVANIMGVGPIPVINGPLQTALNHENMQQVIVGPMYPVLQSLDGEERLPVYDQAMVNLILSILGGVTRIISRKKAPAFVGTEERMLVTLKENARE